MSYIETPSPFAAGTQPDAILEFAFEDPRDNALGLRDRVIRAFSSHTLDLLIVTAFWAFVIYRLI